MTEAIKVKVQGTFAAIALQYALWIHGLITAAISGAATAAGGIVGAQVAGVDILNRQFWVVLGSSAAGGALISVIAYFMRSPLPAISQER